MTTLAELKVENLAKEKELEGSPQDTDENLDLAEDEDDTEELDEAAELDQEDTEDEADPGDTEESELEDWQKADDNAEDEPTFDNSDMASVRRKYKAKLEVANEDHENETTQLKARIEQLEKGAPKALGDEPKLSDFEDNDDPNAAYQKAYMDWKFEEKDAKTQVTQASTEVQQRQQEERVKTDKAVDQHYIRAQELTKKSGIKDEVYQASDLVVRKAVDAVFPKGGDNIVDSIIARLGPGSEKVMFNLGVNKPRLAKFIQSLKNDPTGIEGAIFLGEIKTQLNAPSKRKTKAPDPAKIAKGDKQLTGSMKSAKKAYDGAKDAQGRFDAKKKAKAAGHDTRDW